MRGVLVAGLLALSLGLTACVGTDLQRPPPASEPLLTVAPPAPERAGPTMTDKRPAKDKAYDIHGLLVTSCDYGIYTLPEAPMRQSAPSRLRDDMASVEGDPWHGHAVELQHYAVYENSKRALKEGMAIAYVGLMRFLILRAGEKCAESDMHGGWYAGNEIVNLFPPLVVEMIVNVDGRIHTIRSVYSPRVAVTPKLKQPSDLLEVQQAMIKANRSLLAQLGTPMPASTAAAPKPSSEPAANAVSTPATTRATLVQDDEGFVNFPSSAAH